MPEIAASLFVEESTVKTHLKRILANSDSATASKPSSSYTKRAWHAQARHPRAPDPAARR
jgi:DNA-binding NarL/FixJ family response regulator